MMRLAFVAANSEALRISDLVITVLIHDVYCIYRI